jgi:CheY-like chemotaxis protein
MHDGEDRAGEFRNNFFCRTADGVYSNTLGGALMDYLTSAKLSVRTLILCADVRFLDATCEVLNRLQIAPQSATRWDTALALLRQQKFDIVVADWKETKHLPDLLCALRHSNPDCVLTAVVSELSELQAAFAAGAGFVIHKPASPTQIERCLRAAYQATMCRRRKQHREPVRIAATVIASGRQKRQALIVNLSETGAGLSTTPLGDASGLLSVPAMKLTLSSFCPPPIASCVRQPR